MGTPRTAPRRAAERGLDTRRRILAVAGEVFAERGLRATTVRDLSARARVNIAAIEYHFGGKDGLYETVLTEAYREALAQHPPLRGVAPNAPAEERLRAFVHSFLRRILDTGRPAWFGKLLLREMVEPTEALDGLVDRGMRPLFELLSSIVVELAGKRPATPVLHRCVASVIAQCVFYKHAAPVVRRVSPHQRFDAAALDELADHVARFSIAGIGAIVSRAARGARRSR